MLSVIIMLTSCSVVKRTYVRDYGERIELIKTNFPEIYDLYRRGSVIIDDVYTYEKDGKENGQWLKSIEFKLPIMEKEFTLCLDNDTQNETVCLEKRSVKIWEKNYSTIYRAKSQTYCLM